jgi:DNA primase
MTLPEGKDPDDLIRETPELWDALVESAVPLVDYYFEITVADLDISSAKGKSEAVRRLVPILAEISDQVEQTHYIQKLARMVRMDEPSIRRQLGVQIQLRAKRPVVDQQALEQQPQAIFALEERCLATLFRRPEWLDKANAILTDLSLLPLRQDDFARIENRALFAAWQEIENGTSWQEWIAGLGQSLQLHLDFLLENGPGADELSGENAERDFERSILRLRRKNLDRVIQNLQVLQAESLEQGDARAIEYQHTMIALLHTNRLSLDRALRESTALGQRQKREQVASVNLGATGAA